ncbi:MAG TPA: hypothetical protein PK752_12915 [Accumulibacter sp.]|uniref:hypothetical protein n=1 Tax=Accumulibacter sp. TaxID=2053492 RepID=UPI002B751B94|nr:hypothetical protein [Accumulibacter sp.]HRD89135.1 hypothetical protein [Accumulibacter sp.]
MRACGQCLLEAMQLGRFLLHLSGEEGSDELWGEPFRAFSIPVEAFYESRYVKIGQSTRDIDRIAEAIIGSFTRIPAFASVEAPIRDFARAVRLKTETLRSDGGIFDVWSQVMTAGERLASFVPQAAAFPSCRHLCQHEQRRPTGDRAPWPRGKVPGWGALSALRRRPPCLPSVPGVAVGRVLARLLPYTCGRPSDWSPIQPSSTTPRFRSANRSKSSIANGRLKK